MFVLGHRIVSRRVKKSRPVREDATSGQQKGLCLDLLKQARVRGAEGRQAGLVTFRIALLPHGAALAEIAAVPALAKVTPGCLARFGHGLAVPVLGLEPRLDFAGVLFTLKRNHHVVSRRKGYATRANRAGALW